MGFAVSEDGELTSVYSAIKGKEDILMKEAIKRGASQRLAEKQTGRQENRT
jgi:hypothetical protein